MSSKPRGSHEEAFDVAPAVVRHEEEAVVGVEETVERRARLRKRTESERVEELVPRELEDAQMERVPAADGDSGQIETLPDGSLSIPLFEERIVVTKEVVVRERVIVRKRTIVERQRVEAELRRERIEIEEDVSPD